MNTDAWQVLAPAIETAPIAIVAVNHELRYCLWNAAAVELTGIPTEDAIGRRPGELLGAHVGNPGGAGWVPLVSTASPVAQASSSASGWPAAVNAASLASRST